MAMIRYRDCLEEWVQHTPCSATHERTNAQTHKTSQSHNSVFLLYLCFKCRIRHTQFFVQRRRRRRGAFYRGKATALTLLRQRAQCACRLVVPPNKMQIYSVNIRRRTVILTYRVAMPRHASITYTLYIFHRRSETFTHCQRDADVQPTPVILQTYRCIQYTQSP